MRIEDDINEAELGSHAQRRNVAGQRAQKTGLRASSWDPCLLRSPNGQSDRGRTAAGTRVVLLRTVGDHHDHILLAAQIDEVAGLGDTVDDGYTTVGVHGDVHEEV